MDSGLITLYGEVKTETVTWLWYPYIAIGKVTLLQGDPGDGKSTMMMHLIAEVSKGGKTPDGFQYGRPHKVIYQCSEDGVGDTIKPRLENCGADCWNVAFINEEVHDGLTLDDERIRQAIESYKPRMVVIDPIQAYIGSDSDLQIAVRARRLMRRLGLWASTYNCAIVLIGHMNKREGTKGLYRSLGSIDIVAAARSVLQVDRDEEDSDIRIVHQIKNSLAPLGAEICFEIRPDTGFQWLKDGVLQSHASPDPVPVSQELNLDLPRNKHELAALVIQRLLANGDVDAKTVKAELSKYRVGEKTMQEVKADLGIRSYRKMRVWYWTMDNNKKERDED